MANFKRLETDWHDSITDSPWELYNLSSYQSTNLPDVMPVNKKTRRDISIEPQQSQKCGKLKTKSSLDQGAAHMKSEVVYLRSDLNEQIINGVFKQQ